MSTQTTTHYYVELGYSTALKNNLQKEAFEYLQSLDAKLIEKAAVPDFTIVVFKEFQHLNAKYPRCKPLKIDFERGYPKRDIRLTGFQEVNFKLRACTLSHISQFQNVHSPSSN
jgi:hypothetical protein